MVGGLPPNLARNTTCCVRSMLFLFSPPSLTAIGPMIEHSCALSIFCQIWLNLVAFFEETPWPPTLSINILSDSTITKGQPWSLTQSSFNINIHPEISPSSTPRRLSGTGIYKKNMIIKWSIGSTCKRSLTDGGTTPTAVITSSASK